MAPRAHLDIIRRGTQERERQSQHDDEDSKLWRRGGGRRTRQSRRERGKADEDDSEVRIVISRMAATNCHRPPGDRRAVKCEHGRRNYTRNSGRPLAMPRHGVAAISRWSTARSNPSRRLRSPPATSLFLPHASDVRHHDGETASGDVFNRPEPRPGIAHRGSEVGKDGLRIGAQHEVQGEAEQETKVERDHQDPAPSGRREGKP